MLKGVIFSVEDTIVSINNGPSEELFNELARLSQFLRGKNVEFVVFTNRHWTEAGTGKTLQERLFESWGGFKYFSKVQNPEIPAKPSSSATEYILKEMGWKREEVIYIGASENDMRTAVNGKLLFLRAKWYSDNIDYGFSFSKPKEMAKFFDVFCFRKHLWFHKIETEDFRFLSLAPFSTYKPEYTEYSQDARNTAKHGLGHRDFWVGSIVSSLYFSGIYLDLNFITSYPGHKEGSGNAIMDEAIGIFSKCFRIKYLPDLIIRHKTSTRSHVARNTGIQINHLNQLNTIKLNPHPMKNRTEAYKNLIPLSNKTVLVLDDISTRGFSLEAARLYLQRAGAKVVLVSWLKTINTDYEEIRIKRNFKPFEENQFNDEDLEKINSHTYAQHITDNQAPKEITELLKEYDNWDWP